LLLLSQLTTFDGIMNLALALLYIMLVFNIAFKIREKEEEKGISSGF